MKRRTARKTLFLIMATILIAFATALSYIYSYNRKLNISEGTYECMLERMVTISDNETIDLNSIVPIEWDEMYYIGIPYISKEHFVRMVNDNRIKYRDIANDACGRIIILNDDKVVFDWFIWADEFKIKDEYLHINSEDAMFIVSKSSDINTVLEYVHQ